MNDNVKDLFDDVEYIVQCDSKGTIIGPISKEEAHSEEIRGDKTHYSTWSMIFHLPSGRYGIQLKNPKKHDSSTGGKWDMGVAGHNPYVKEGNSWRPLGFEENLVKEAKEEIGLEVTMQRSPEEFLGSVKGDNKEATGYIFDRFHYEDGINNEWVGLGFIITFTTEVDFVDGEVVDFKWVKPKELHILLSEKDKICRPLPLVFEKAEEFRMKYISE